MGNFWENDDDGENCGLYLQGQPPPEICAHIVIAAGQETLVASISIHNPNFTRATRPHSAKEYLASIGRPLGAKVPQRWLIPPTPGPSKEGGSCQLFNLSRKGI
jgi:hypothetical protein